MSSIFDDHELFNVKTVLFIIGFSFFTGTFIGSTVDLFTLSYPFVSMYAKFPCRQPFDQISVWISLLADINLMVTFIFQLVKKKATVKDKISVFIFVGIISVVFAVLFSFMWLNGIELIHDFKAK